MTTRRRWHFAALAAAALIVAGCGGGTTDSPLASRVIAFGDSLTDIGAYTPATQIPQGQAPGVAPFFGGKFTTNNHTGYTAASNSSTANIWVEWIAARLGVAITPHEVGFGPQSVKCPAAAVNPALAGSCTGYAQGGSRVTSPAGIGNPNGNGINGTSPAPMTRPMVTQVADHLARFQGFSGSDIVFVFGGNNDVFVQFGAVGQGLPAATAIANVRTAATELATLVKDQIIARGASRVAVMTLPDASTAPGFAALAAPQKGLLSQLSAEFNSALLAGLDGTVARVIDVRALNAAVLANPSAFGISNVTTTACDPAKIQTLTQGRVTDGSSLFCNASSASVTITGVPVPVPLNTLRTGASASTYLFADSVHPTTGGHKVLADQVWAALKDFGWVPSNL